MQYLDHTAGEGIGPSVGAIEPSAGVAEATAVEEFMEHEAVPLVAIRCRTFPQIARAVTGQAPHTSGASPPSTDVDVLIAAGAV